MTVLDETNVKMLDSLQRDARTPVSGLARQLGRAESTVRERLIGLERAGVIRGYRAVVDASKVGYAVRAVLRADLDHRDPEKLGRALQSIPSVVRAYVTTGHRPLRIEVVAESLVTLEDLIARRLAPLGLGRLETEVLVTSLVDERPIRLEPLALAVNGANGR